MEKLVSQHFWVICHIVINGFLIIFLSFFGWWRSGSWGGKRGEKGYPCRKGARALKMRQGTESAPMSQLETTKRFVRNEDSISSIFRTDISFRNSNCYQLLSVVISDCRGYYWFVIGWLRRQEHGGFRYWTVDKMGIVGKNRPVDQKKIFFSLKIFLYIWFIWFSLEFSFWKSG